MARAGYGELRGAELAQALRSRLTRAAIAANLTGALTAFVFGVISPVPIDEADQVPSLLLNVAGFVVFMGTSLPLGNAWARKVIGDPIERWLVEARPPTEAERRVVLRQPFRVVGISATFWGIGAIFFGALNSTVSPELGAAAAVIAILGGATTAALSSSGAPARSAIAISAMPPSGTAVTSVHVTVSRTATPGDARPAGGAPPASARVTTGRATWAATWHEPRSRATCGWAESSARWRCCSWTSWAPPRLRRAGRPPRSWPS